MDKFIEVGCITILIFLILGLVFGYTLPVFLTSFIGACLISVVGD